MGGWNGLEAIREGLEGVGCAECQPPPPLPNYTMQKNLRMKSRVRLV